MSSLDMTKRSRLMTRRSQSDLTMPRHSIFHHVPAVRIEPSLEPHRGAVVVAMQGFAAVAREGDEMRRGEDQVLFRDGDPEFAAGAHRVEKITYGGGAGGSSCPVATRHTSSASHSRRCWAYSSSSSSGAPRPRAG